MVTQASHVWRPSAARTLKLDQRGAVTGGGNSTLTSALSWPTKDPNDVLDYQLDISGAIIGNSGDGIETLDVSIWPASTGDLALNSATADGAVAVLWLGSGIAGTTYTVTVRMGTVAGRVIVRDVLLPVLALSSPIGGPGILAGSGVLLAQNGTLGIV